MNDREQMPPENCPEVSCVNWTECGGGVWTSKIKNAAELRRCPACGVLLVLVWDTSAKAVRVWPAASQLAAAVSSDFEPKTEAARRYMGGA